MPTIRTSRSSTTRRKILAAVAACATIAGAILLLAVNDRAEGGPPSPIELASRLEEAPVESFDPASGVFVEVAAVRAEAAAVMAEVPFPPARNGAAELDWAAQGALTRGDVQLLVQANAMCDWIEYALETAQIGQLSSSTRTVLQSIPAWPAMRTLPFHHQLSEAIAAVVSREDLAPLRALREQACVPPRPPSDRAQG
jgi:hypothetical protein